MSRSTSRARLLAAAPLAALSLLALTACGPSTGSTAAEGGEETDFSGVEPATEISFWTNHPGGSIDIEKQLIADFTAETGITVNHVTAGANYEEVSQKFQTAQASGEVGDVVVLSDATWFPNYLNGSLAPIDPILEAADVDPSTYVSALFGDYLYEGSHYGVPYARSTPLFYFNKDHYAQAGLGDEAPATWQEAEEFSTAIQAAVPSATAFGFPPQAEYPAWTMSNLVWAFGGAWSDEWDFDTLTSEGTVEALEFAQGAIDAGWAGVVSNDPASDFSAGAVSQAVASTGSLKGILDAADFEVGVGFLPTGPDGDDTVVPTGGAGLAIAAKSSPEKQLAAAKFVDFMTNAANTATFSAGTGYLPVRTDADMSDVYATNPAFEVAVDQLSRARSQDYARVFLPGGDLALSRTLQSLLTTDADVTTTLTALQEELQGLYDSDLKAELEG